MVEIKDYTFLEELVRGHHIFKIPHRKKSAVFVSDELREAVLNSNLKGYRFIEVWDSSVSHQETENYRNALLEKIEMEKGEEFPYLTARELVEQGETVASGEWRLTKDNMGQLLMGKLKSDGSYIWLLPMYFPPIFHDLKWHVVGK